VLKIAMSQKFGPHCISKYHNNSIWFITDLWFHQIYTQYWNEVLLTD